MKKIIKSDIECHSVKVKKTKVIDIISIMPEYFDSPLHIGLINKAIKNGVMEINIINPRDFSNDKHKRVDDRIYGGGAGQLLMAEPILKAHEFAKNRYNEKYGGAKTDNRAANKMTCSETDLYKEDGNTAAKESNNGNAIDNNCNYNGLLTVIMSASGKLLDSNIAIELSRYNHIIIVCGRYEGIDARVSELTNALELSIGNFILSGGEIASLVFIETIGRHFENFLGNSKSLTEESFHNNCGSAALEYPQYTSPRVVEGIPVPDVLVSGNHKLINDWRSNNGIKKTTENRPDLIEGR